MIEKKARALHRPVLRALIASLEQVFNEGRHADKVIEHVLRSQRQMGSRDRRFIAEGHYEIVRWWRLLWATLGEEPSTNPDDLWRLVGVWLISQGDELPPWPEFQGLNISTLEEANQRALEQPAVRESVPDWLYELGRAQLKESWDDILAASNIQAPVILRVNTLKATREVAQQQLAAEEIRTDIPDDLADALILPERKNVFRTKAFQQGFFEMQDGASQQVGPLLDVKPGMRVIDACAGAGGKTLHLGALMKNKGKILALDTSEYKLTELRRRASRAGCDIIELKHIENNKVIKRLEGTADRVLLDVPCSGLGVLRRNPDAKWKLQAEDITRFEGIQAEILEGYSLLVKPGGKLVYATCSVLPSENWLQIERFLSTHPGWKLLEEKRLSPSIYDGFYAACLQRLT